MAEADSRHFLVEIKSLTLCPGAITPLSGADGFEARIYLAGTMLDTPLYDVLRVPLGPDGRCLGPAKAVFRDLPPNFDINLVCLLFRTIASSESKSSKKESSSRKPFAISVVELANVNGLRVSNAETVLAMSLWSCPNESLFYQAPQGPYYMQRRDPFVESSLLVSKAVKSQSDELKAFPAGCSLNIGTTAVTGTADTAGSLMRSLMIQQVCHTPALNLVQRKLKPFHLVLDHNLETFEFDCCERWSQE